MRYSVNCPRSELAVSPISLGWSSNPRVTHFGPAKRDQYIIHYVTKGEGYFLGRPVRAGQGFLITPGLLEEYHASSEDPWTFLWLISYGSDMEKIFRFLGANEYGIFEYDFVERLEPILDYISTNHGSYIGVLEMQELFYKVLHLHEKSERTSEVRKSSQLYLDYAVEMIERDYARGVTVREVCERLGVSEPYLYRIFKEKFGKSPKRYITDFRLLQGRILLSETDLSVTDVGRAVGFEDVLAFSKFFKSEVGVSPTDYREERERQKG